MTEGISSSSSEASTDEVPEPLGSSAVAFPLYIRSSVRIICVHVLERQQHDLIYLRGSIEVTIEADAIEVLVTVVRAIVDDALALPALCSICVNVQHLTSKIIKPTSCG